MKKIYYKKLVRDRIPKRIEEGGGKYRVEILSDSDFEKALMQKVDEEAGGLSNAKDRKEIVSEMGDLLDVLEEVKKIFAVSSEELRKSRENEFKRKGGFKKRIFLVWSEDTGYKTNEKKGRKK